MLIELKLIHRRADLFDSMEFYLCSVVYDSHEFFRICLRY